MRKLKNHEIDLLRAARECRYLDTPGAVVKYRKLTQFCSLAWVEDATTDDDGNPVGMWAAWTYEDNDDLTEVMTARDAEVRANRRKTAGRLC